MPPLDFRFFFFLNFCKKTKDFSEKVLLPNIFPTNSYLMVSAMHKYILILALLFFNMSIYSQIVIKEKVELNPTNNSMKPQQLSLTQSTITRQLDVEFSFTPYSFPLPPGPDGYIYGEATIRREISQSNRPMLASSGQVQGGFAYLSVQLNIPYNEVWWISVGSSFGAYPAFDPIQFNSGNANVQVKIYLDGILQPESYSSSTYNQGYALLVIATPPDPCANVPECIFPFIEVPNFNTSLYPNGYFGEDNCAKEGEDTGGLFAIYNNYEDYDIDVCYNKQLDRWQFNVNGGILSPIAILDICPNNIALHNWKIIENITDITTVYGDTNPCAAKKDFEGHRSYPQTVRDGGYIIKDVIMMHEHAHRRFYESLFEDYKNKLKKDFEEYHKTCTEFNYEEASTKGANEIRVKLIKHLDLVQKIYGLHTQESARQQHEEYIQKSDYVKNTIDYYIGLLEVIYNCI